MILVSGPHQVPMVTAPEISSWRPGPCLNPLSKTPTHSPPKSLGLVVLLAGCRSRPTPQARSFEWLPVYTPPNAGYGAHHVAT